MLASDAPALLLKKWPKLIFESGFWGSAKGQNGNGLFHIPVRFGTAQSDAVFRKDSTLNSSGFIKPVIIGVATTVLATYILSQIGLNEDGGSTDEYDAGHSTQSTEDLLQRQKELERRIQELTDSKELARRQDELEKKFQQVSRRTEAEYSQIDEFEDDEPATGSSSTRDISGMWQDPTTGASYQISQFGHSFNIKEFSFGVVSASGSGRFSGRNGTFSYNTLLGTYGNGTIQVSTDGSHLHVAFSDLTTGANISIALYR